VPIIDLLLKELDELHAIQGLKTTLLGLCPVSIDAIKASLLCAKFLNFPLMFVATLNQVDIDGGYTGLTQKDFVELVRREADKIGFAGPLIIALDHGGPWTKDKHVAEGFSYEETIEWVKKSIKECIAAGYDHLHIDTTIDITLKEGELLSIDVMVERTVNLIEFSEEVRRELDAPRISYEVGTEEIHGGITSPEKFEEFIVKLRRRLKERGLQVWPTFIVGNVGTYLSAVNKFDESRAKTLIEIARANKLYVKGHYTDYVSNPEDYPKAGMGAANVGPELSHAEYEAIVKLSTIEDKLSQKGLIEARSRASERIKESIISGGRWRKWLTKEEKGLDFDQLAPDRQAWLLGSCARYVLTSPEVIEAKSKLLSNLRKHLIRGEDFIVAEIGKVIEKYVNAFNLRSLNYLLDLQLTR